MEWSGVWTAGGEKRLDIDAPLTAAQGSESNNRRCSATSLFSEPSRRGPLADEVCEHERLFRHVPESLAICRCFLLVSPCCNRHTQLSKREDFHVSKPLVERLYLVVLVPPTPLAYATSLFSVSESACTFSWSWRHKPRSKGALTARQNLAWIVVTFPPQIALLI